MISYGVILLYWVFDYHPGSTVSQTRNDIQGNSKVTTHLTSNVAATQLQINKYNYNQKKCKWILCKRWILCTKTATHTDVQTTKSRCFEHCTRKPTSAASTACSPLANVTLTDSMLFHKPVSQHPQLLAQEPKWTCWIQLRYAFTLSVWSSPKLQVRGSLI